jgi:hypothetical protein
MTKKLILLFVPYLFLSCNEYGAGNGKIKIKSVEHVYQSIYGEEYMALGEFKSENKDSIEEKHWHYTNESYPLVVFGDYTNGLQSGEWKFALSTGQVLSSTWNLYNNETLRCKFSLPFSCADTLGNKYLLKLATTNDSLGKISILVGASDTSIKDQDLRKYGIESESALREQGFTFTRNSKEIYRDKARYVFTEYFMKDSKGEDVKLYNVYGYTPSHKNFVQFGLFHNGPHDDLVKIIYNLMVESLYIDNERFLNPYLK